MATQVLQPQAVPEPTISSTPRRLTVLEEVAESSKLMRERLEGAITMPPPGVSESDLPTVPLIDLKGALGDNLEAKKAVAAQIRQACITTGFFQITNHGIRQESIDGILKKAKQFFDEITEKQKDEMHCRRSELFRGYEPGDFSYVNPDDGKAKDGEKPEVETKEAFNWGYEESLDPTGGDGKYVELDGTPPRPDHGNVWPSEKEMPGFQAAIKDYYSQVLTLCRHLFDLFALSLGLDEDYFKDVMTHPGAISRILHYPAQPAAKEPTEKDSKLGLGAHTDYECFTVLLADENPGLQILFPPSPATNGRPIWRPCPVRDHSITINVADFFQRWTNGMYKSTIHRVISKMGSKERYSVPTFFSINYDADVKPLPESVVGKTKYHPLKAGEYVLERLRATRKEDE